MKTKKTKSFIYEKSVRLITKKIKNARTFNNKLKQIKDPDTGLTKYMQFRNWLLDILEYGFLLSIIYAVFISWPGFLKYLALIIGLGILRHMFLDLLNDIVRRIKTQ